MYMTLWQPVGKLRRRGLLNRTSLLTYIPAYLFDSVIHMSFQLTVMGE